MTTKWPEQPECLFRADSDWHNNACVNCYPPRMDMAAESYLRGANALAQSALCGDATIDFVVLPIVFLYRQYVELILKDLINKTRQLSGQPAGFPATHRLSNLWAEASKLVEDHYGQAIGEFKFVKPCIDEFMEHDPESFAFRYPTDKKGNATLRDIPHINIRHLSETMHRVSAFLDSLSTDLQERLNCLAEMQAEAARDCY